MRAAASLAAVMATTALLSCAAPALADHHDSNLPWPAALPPMPTSSDVQPMPVRNCRHPGIRCMTGLERRLRAQWRPLHRACDHRALFSLAYLRITELLRRDISRTHPRWFHDKRWMELVITTFSNRYFRWFGNYERGKPVPEAWRITFDQARTG